MREAEAPTTPDLQRGSLGIQAAGSVRRGDTGVSTQYGWPGAMPAKLAAAYLGGFNPRWRDDAPIPRSDSRKPGASRPLWVWRKIDPDAFLEQRLVAPGRASPWG